MDDHAAHGREGLNGDVVNQGPGDTRNTGTRNTGQHGDGAPEDDVDAVASPEAAARFWAGECRFLRGARTVEDLPPISLPEIAFAGRSNVGKSSLVNALTGRRTLARTSVTPGRTQEINFFDLAGHLILVDLPGYGYAKAPKGEVDRWNRLIRLYLRGRPSLLRVALLIDARHGPKPNDEDAMALLDDAAVSYQVVLTKADKLSVTQQEAVLERTRAVARRHVAAFPEILLTSAEKGLGIEALRTGLATLAGVR